MTTKTIGTGGDYTTVQSWEDAAPSGTLTDLWEGLVKNQELTGSSATCTFSGNTPTSSYYKVLRTDTGASFKDNANASTNALRYNASNGAALSNTSGSTQLMNVSEAYVQVKNLQLKQTGTGSNVFYVTVNNLTIRDCIVHSGGGTYTALLAGNNHLAVNTLIIVDKVGGYGVTILGTGHIYIACTLVRPSNYTATEAAFRKGSVHAGDPLVRDCAFFGFTSLNFSGWATGSGYNATDQSSAPGSNNQTSLTYADQFESTS